MFLLPLFPFPGLLPPLLFAITLNLFHDSPVNSSPTARACPSPAACLPPGSPPPSPSWSRCPSCTPWQLAPAPCASSACPRPHRLPRRPRRPLPPSPSSSRPVRPPSTPSSLRRNEILPHPLEPVLALASPLLAGFCQAILPRIPLLFEPLHSEPSSLCSSISLSCQEALDKIHSHSWHGPESGHCGHRGGRQRSKAPPVIHRGVLCSLGARTKGRPP